MYQAPLEDLQFLIDDVLRAEDALGGLPEFAGLEVGPDLTGALLAEAGRLAAEVVAPLRRAGDQHPVTCDDGRITLSPGYAEALQQLAAGGWLGVAADPEYGGQGLPELYNTAAFEMWNGADLAFGLAPMLSTGAALALHAHGSEALKRLYLPRLHSGEWTGTMNLTEGGAGSDLGVLKTRAEPEGDHYRIRGQKIYITWGDHEAAENIIHLVLARLPDAPEGSRGISLFLVPKYRVNDDGSLGERNDVWPVSTEHKLGIHGSPTCVMAFGDKEGAIGYLVGEENRGLACMFTMMNEARLKVGVQGLAAAEGARQQALGYARERVQGGVAIIHHPDVRRMLLTMSALTEAMRALACSEALTLDLAHRGPEAERPAQQARIDLMIPVIKAWMTELGEEVASLGIQVHGGMGYIEETGAAQFLRDVRITSIYEGTNGIQAADLVARKLARDGGGALATVLEAVGGTASQLSEHADPGLCQLGSALEQARSALETSADLLLQRHVQDPARALGGSFDFLMQCGYLFGGWQLARGALVAAARAAGSDNPFYPRKVATAVAYGELILPRCAAHAGAVTGSGGQLADFPEAWL